MNISDIVNNWSSTATDKPLSANIGKLLNDDIISFCTIHSMSQIPSTFNGGTYAFTVNASNGLNFGGVTVPAWSKGIIISTSSGTTNDCTMCAIDNSGNVYVAYRNGATWVSGSKIPKNLAYYVGIRGTESQLHGAFANTVEFVKYCRDIRNTEDINKLGRGYAPWTFHCDGISSGGFFGASGFTAIAFFTSANYGWIHCLSDNATYGFAHICVNSSTAYIHIPTTTRTSISLA